MFTRHVVKKLSAYCHGELPQEESRQVAAHLRSCEHCRKELEEIKLGIQLAEWLPRRTAPAAMWSEIERLLEAEHLPTGRRPSSFRLAFSAPWARWAAVSVLLFLVLGVTTIWYRTHSTKPSWEIARIEGEPKVGSNPIGQTSRLAVGEWLETDGASRATLKVGEIGEVNIEPNTRVRLVNSHLTEHRLKLQRGTMHALIWAPPRLFFVETPSAVAVDLGCAYTLEVDDAGAGLLSVTSGWVAFERNGRESFVPMGAQCVTRPEIGPGTPYFEDAPAALREALHKLDFEPDRPNERAAALNVILAESRPRDGLTLWHLLTHVREDERSRVYDRMAALVPPPQGVTRAGILKGDRQMLDLWWNELGLRDASWWRLWKGPWPPQAR